MRGRYKIFLGMAAGVGKTYRMLQEGKAEQSAGREVVIGYLEPHERPETELQAEGIERLPRRQVEHRGAVMEEMDLPAIFQRAPELCLIDELAHSNAPGLEHGKRYEDIEDVLDAGIDVFSTVNVQHLESLNDRVAELTGVRVRETFPDSVLASADEVVLVDLTPEALIGRLRAGKVYPAERVSSALNNFFRVENLAALREVALRQTAEEVESKRFVGGAGELLGTREELLADEAPQALGRARARAGHAPNALAAARAARLALVAAAGRRARPAVRAATGLAAARRGARAARGAAAARLDPGQLADRRRGRRPRGHRGARGGGARHDLRADRAAAAAQRPAAPCGRVAAGPAGAKAPRRGRAHRGRPLAAAGGGVTTRILFPFVGTGVSRAALEATLRLARAREATLMPAYLAIVPHHLSLDAAVPVREAEAAVPLLELIEQRATAAGVAVDARIERGRSPRHALTELLEHERYDTLVLPARTGASDGFAPAEVAWALGACAGRGAGAQTGSRSGLTPYPERG